MLDSKRKNNLFNPRSKKPFKLSRSKIDLFLECPRCFYLDQRLGVRRPSGPAFTLNIAVDHLLKKEFDIHRAKRVAHPLMKHYGIEAVPVDHSMLQRWRSNFGGIQYFHKPTNFIIYGAIDDLWQDKKGNFIVVEYKATSTSSEIKLEGGYKEVYKRQAEVYQWLLRQNRLQVSDTAYFVFCNGKKDKEAFDGKLEFDIQIIPYKGNDLWVEKTVKDIKRCLNSGKIPKADSNCEFCRYRKSAEEILK